MAYFPSEQVRLDTKRKPAQTEKNKKRLQVKRKGTGRENGRQGEDAFPAEQNRHKNEKI